MKPGESRGASGPLAQLAQLKEAGRLWIEAMDRDSEAYVYIEHCGEILDELEAVFRRILERE